MVTMRFSQGFLRLIALSLLHALISWSLIPILTPYPEIRYDLCRYQCLRRGGVVGVVGVVGGGDAGALESENDSSRLARGMRKD